MIRKTVLHPVRLALACACAALVLHAPARAADQKPNKALATAGATVYVSSAPNPAWPATQAVDGLLDTTHGWIASVDGDGQPWIALEFDQPVRVETIIFYQAGLTEGGANRFARPRRLRIEMDNIEPRIVTLEDRERVPQRLEIEPSTTGVIKIDILSTYSDARFPALAGFQEIEVYEGSLPVGGGETSVSGEQPADEPDPILDEVQSTITHAASIMDTDNGAPQTDSGENGKGLDPRERELLELLRAFTARLEQYMENN